MNENRRMVFLLASKMKYSHPSFVDFEELIWVGNTALLKAARDYDPNHFRGISFSTYAWQCIDFAIRKACRQDYKNSKGITICSLEAPVGDGGDAEVQDFIADETSEDGYRSIELKDAIHAGLSAQNPIERQAVELYYGFDGNESERWSLERIGKILGYSRQGVSLILERAYNKMRPMLAA